MNRGRSKKMNSNSNSSGFSGILVENTANKCVLVDNGCLIFKAEKQFKPGRVPTQIVMFSATQSQNPKESRISV
jgi:hypothetical protein